MTYCSIVTEPEVSSPLALLIAAMSPSVRATSRLGSPSERHFVVWLIKSQWFRPFKATQIRNDYLVSRERKKKTTATMTSNQWGSAAALSQLGLVHIHQIHPIFPTAYNPSLPRSYA